MNNWSLKHERTGRNYDEKGLVFGDRIFSVVVKKEEVVFREECDGCFYKTLVKNDAIAMLNKIIEYIKCH